MSHSLHMFEPFLIECLRDGAIWILKDLSLFMIYFKKTGPRHWFIRTEIIYSHHAQYNSNRTVRHNAALRYMSPLSQVQFLDHVGTLEASYIK
jgi:hypothetical protein